MDLSVVGKLAPTHKHYVPPFPLTHPPPIPFVIHSSHRNIILPVNKYNVQLSELTKEDKTTYWDIYPGEMLPATACANPFNFDEAFDQMARNPPVDLFEKYFSCTRSVQTTLVMGVGTAYSSTNVMANIIWTILGFFTIWGWKRLLKRTGSKEAVVSHRTKERLEGLFTALKDESLVSVVDDLLGVIQTQDARLKALEARSGVQGGSEDEREVVAKLRDFYRDSSPRGDLFADIEKWKRQRSGWTLTEMMTDVLWPLSETPEASIQLPFASRPHYSELRLKDLYEANNPRGDLFADIEKWNKLHPGRPINAMLTDLGLKELYEAKKIDSELFADVELWKREHPCRPLNEMLTERLLSSFYSLYDSKGQEADNERLGALLSKEANEDMAKQMEGFQNIFKRFTNCWDWAEQKFEKKAVVRKAQKRLSAYHGQSQEHGQLEVEMRNRHEDQDHGMNEYDGDDNEDEHHDDVTLFNPQHQAHPFSSQPHASRRESQGLAQPLPAAASPAAASVPSNYDAKIVASNLRKLSVLSQRGGLAGSGSGSGSTQPPPQIHRHPMTTVLSGISPPAAADLNRHDRTRK